MVNFFLHVPAVVVSHKNPLKVMGSTEAKDSSWFIQQFPFVFLVQGNSQIAQSAMTQC